MSLQDIDNLPLEVANGSTGHIEDTNKIIGGLKTLKSSFEANQTTLDSKYQKPSGGIPTSDIANSAITDAKLAGSISPSKITGTAVINNDSRLSDQRVPTNNSVTIAKISATGSASSTTYLRGDGTWAEPPTGGGGGSGTVTSANITDASTIGRSILTGADSSSIRNTLGAASNILSGYSSTTGTVAATDTIVQAIGKLNGNSAGKAPISHTHAISDLTATGIKDSTTFLRGDGTWATPAGGSGGGPSSSNIGNTTASQSVDVSNAAGKIIRATLAVATTTFSFNNVVAGARWTMEIKQDATGSRNALWSSVNWVPSAPIISKAASSINLFEFFSPDGTTIYGFFLNPTVGYSGLPYPAPSTRYEPVPRILAASESSMTKGMTWLIHFVADRDFVVSNIITHQTGTVSAGATLARLGLYQYNGGNSYTCIARSANTPSRWNTVGENVAPIVDNGASTPSAITSVALKAGQEYAYSLITVGNTTEPQMRAAPVSDKGSLSPRMGAVLYGSTDLTPTITTSTPSWMLFWAGLT